MSSILGFKKLLTEQLQTIPLLEDVEIQAAYPAIQLPAPFAADALVIDMIEFAMNDTASNRLYEQVAEITGTINHRDVEIKAGLSIYISEKKGSRRCDELFSAICDFVLFEMECDVISYKGSKIRYDKNLHAYALDSILHLRTSLVREDV